MITSPFCPRRKNTSNSVGLEKTLKSVSAFTLAEVLIVIGIIGIVANMTIPTLMQNIEEQFFLTQFRETYSMLQQVYIQVAQENGTADQWATDGTAMYNMLRPYLKTIKDCPDGSCSVIQGKYRTLVGGATSSGLTYHMILANGATLSFDVGDGFPAIQIDVNGYKGPNEWGHDAFEFEFTKKNEGPFISWPYYTGNMSSFVEIDSSTCNKSSSRTGFWNGAGCSYWIIKNGNMDYLHRNISNTEWIR